MPKHKTHFRTSAGEQFPPALVQAQIVKGRLYTHWRGAGWQEMKRERTIKGARLLRMEPAAERPIWIVELTAKWWDAYFALRRGQPLPSNDDAEPVVEQGALVPGSFDALMLDFKANSDTWKRTKPRTKKGHEVYMNRISENYGSLKVAQMEARHVKEFISKVRFGDPTAADPKCRVPRTGAAKSYYTIFGLLFDHAVELGWATSNPIRGKQIEKPKTLNKKGLHTLTEPEVDALRLAHPDYASDERAYLEMGCHWGARASDLIGLGFKDIANGEIRFTPEKTEGSTGAEVVLPVAGEHLLAVLAARSTRAAFFFQQPPKGSNQWNRDKVVDLNPRCWEYTRARKMFIEMRERAGLVTPEGELPATSHSMRKYFATRMANAGASLTDIADALGDTEESARIYVQQRNKRAGSARAFNAALAA